MIEIQNDVLISKTPVKTATIGTIIGLLFCCIIGYFCAVPLIQGTHPDLPRSFFLAMTLCAGGFGFAMIYGLMNHLIEVKINPSEKRIFLIKRVMGHEEKRTINFTDKAHFTEEVTSRYDEETRKQRAAYDIQFVNGKTTLKISNGDLEERAIKLREFAQQHGIAYEKKKTGLNIWIAGGTFLFMAVMMVELYFMGAFN